MRLIEELRAEHDLIEAVAGSLRTFVAARRQGRGDPADGQAFLTFLRLYAGHFHHAREEDTLFAALVQDVRLPESGPIETLVGDHRRLAALLEEIEPLIAADVLNEASGAALERLATDYSRGLWHHIDAENFVLLPESEVRLRKHGIRELPSRALTGEEEAAMRAGQALLKRYPPMQDAGVVRGDGCVCCPAFVEGCKGLEREWWNEWEWEELDDHLSAG